MFKYLIPFIFVSTVAFADDSGLKLHHHFDNMSEWNGTLALTLPKAPPPSPALGNKCSIDDLKTVADYLHSFGYTALIVADDKNRDNVRDEIMYNKNDNTILSLTIFFEKPLTEGDPKDPDSNKMVKLCIEFQGKDTYGDGAAFKDFVIGQKIGDFNRESDERDQYERDKSAGKLKAPDGTPMRGEPYQGDLTKAGYIQ